MNSMHKFTITTLGCKVNQYESEAIAMCLKESGWNISDKEKDAELCIVNTCTVTGKASMQSRQAIRRAIRSNPKACIIVTGCYAQTEPDEIKKIAGVHYIIGHADKHRIPEIIISSSGNILPECTFPLLFRNDIWREHNFKQIPATLSGGRTRPFLKIQDGCSEFCTYCIVPYARGRSRSMPFENVLDEIKKLKEAGYHEVVLTGIHLGCYGFDLKPKQSSLLELLTCIHTSKAIDRVRLSSIEPCELTEKIIKLVAESGSFCHHFHIPLQSGDDLILKRMRRPYTSSYFKDLVFKIHELIPDAAIGVDILTGFPGETEVAFENTYSVIKQLPVTYLHIFPFSARNETPAGKYPDKIPAQIIKTRCRKMHELGNIKKREFYKKNVGKEVKVLIEGKRDRLTGYLKGMTSNYMSVFLSGGDDVKNTIVKVGIEKVNSDNLIFGSILK